MEIEIKFYVPWANLEDIRSSVKLLHAQYASEVFETNFVFENADETLRRSEVILRLRRDKRSTLTYKEPPLSDEATEEFKARNEIEVEVDDFDKTLAILGKLGFHPVLTYEKKRETYQLPHLTIQLDHLPFGWFLELEGPGTAIQAVAKELQLNWNERIRESYVRIFEDLHQRTQLPFRDLTFKNFRSIDNSALQFDVFVQRYWASAR